MDNKGFIQKIAEITENNAADLSMNMRLEDVEGWGSLAVVTLIAICESDYNIPIKARELKEAKTLGDVYKLIVDGKNTMRSRRR